jgi:hypothetical protein
MKLRHWDVDLSYLVPPGKGGRSWRTNLHVGVLAVTIIEAIETAVAIMPREATGIFVLSANHKGTVDGISLDGNTTEAIHKVKLAEVQ